MKLTIIISLIFIGANCAFKVEQFPDFEGKSEIIESDSEGNTYIVENNEGIRKFWKINSEREVWWKIDIIDEVYKIIITSQNDVYVFFWPEGEGIHLATLNEDTASFVEIDSFHTYNFVIDNDDNIIYSKEEGINLLRPKSNSPILIQNLEGFSFSDEKQVITDSEGNIYIAAKEVSTQANYIAIITNDAKQEEIPHADLVFLAVDRNVESILLDQNQNLWVISYLTNGRTPYGYIEKLVNGAFELIFYDEKHQGHKATAAKDRIYVITWTQWPSVPGSVFYITLDNEIVEIPELAKLTFDQDYGARLISDKNGNVYFGGPQDFESLINSSLGVITYEEANPVGIQFEKSGSLYDWLVDQEDNLWVLQMGVFRVMKGENIAETVDTSDLPYYTFTHLHLNKKANEIFILGSQGLYYVSDFANI